MAILIVDESNADIDYVRKSLTIQDAVTGRGTLTFTHIGTSAPLDWGQDVFVRDVTDEDLEFVGGGIITLVGGGALDLSGYSLIWAGTTESVQETDITVGSADQIAYRYTCIDFSQLAARQIVIATYTSTTAGAIVTALAGDAFMTNLGVSVGTIETGATIESITFNYLTLESCLDELTEMSGFHWDIDKDKKLNFRAVDSVAAAFDLTASNKPYESITFSRSRGAMVNDVYIRAGNQVSSDTTVEVQLGDGNRRAFALPTELSGEPTIEIDIGAGYVSQTVGVNGVDSGVNWYYNIGRSTIVQSTSDTVLGSTDKVRATYFARFPLIVRATDAASIASRASVETGAGVYQRVIDATDVESADDARLRADSALSQYANGRLQMTYTTTTGGLEAGQSQFVNLSAHNVSTRFLIEQINISMLENGTLRYSITAAANQTVASMSFWKQKSRQDRKFVVRDNEIVDLLRTLADDITLSDAPTATTYAGAYTVNGLNTYANLFHVG